MQVTLSELQPVPEVKLLPTHAVAHFGNCDKSCPMTVVAIAAMVKSWKRIMLVDVVRELEWFSRIGPSMKWRRMRRGAQSPRTYEDFCAMD